MIMLEVKNLKFGYSAMMPVLNDISFQAGNQEIVAILGSNGAGKTTFFNMCTGMYTPTKGKVYLMGEDVTGFSSERVARKRMARTFQNLQLFKFMSVLDNVKIGCHIRTKSNLVSISYFI